MSTAQRWGEVAIQAAAQKASEAIIATFGAPLKDERAHNVEVMKENREVIGLLRQFIADAMGQSVALRKLASRHAADLRGDQALRRHS